MKDKSAPLSLLEAIKIIRWLIKSIFDSVVVSMTYSSSTETTTTTATTLTRQVDALGPDGLGAAVAPSLTEKESTSRLDIMVMAWLDSNLVEKMIKGQK